jgi:hypothetical protein
MISSSVVSSRSALVLAVLLALACISMPCAALQSKVLTLTERNLSIDLDGGFQVAQSYVDNSTDGIFTQTLLITNARSEGAAFLQVGSVFDPTSRALSAESFSSQWITGVMTPSAPGNGTTAGNWTVADRLGQNVTVVAVHPEVASMQAFGKTMNIACWELPGNNYVGLMSFFDRNVTDTIIGTLSLS